MDASTESGAVESSCRQDADTNTRDGCAPRITCRAHACRTTKPAVNAIPQYRELETRILAAMRGGLAEPEFGALALAIHRFQRQWNAPYGKWCATRPEPRNWREIPAVPQAMFKRYALSVAPDEVTKTFRTSGTTGEGHGEHHLIDTQLYDAAILHGWDRLRMKTDPAFVILAPSPEEAPHSSLSHMFGVLARERGSRLSVFILEDDGSLDAERFLNMMSSVFHAHQPVGLLGTALAFLNLFEQLGTRGEMRRKGSFAIETGGYKGSGRDVPKAELYAKFGEHFDIRPDAVINEYGMTELSSQFYSRGLGQAHDGPPWLRGLVIDPETEREVAVGESGVLRIFDLANLGSVLAIQTQDLAIRREHGFELLGRDPAALPRGCSRAADERMRR